MRKFEVGEVVECIRGATTHPLRRGEKYTITGYNEDVYSNQTSERPSGYYVDGVPGVWLPDRFKKLDIGEWDKEDNLRRSEDNVS